MCIRDRSITLPRKANALNSSINFFMMNLLLCILLCILSYHILVEDSTAFFLALCIFCLTLKWWFKNASAFLLRGARHAIAWHTSTAHLCKSTLRFGRRKTIVHRTMCALPEAISAGGLTPTTDTSLFLTTYRGRYWKTVFAYNI